MADSPFPRDDGLYGYDDFIEILNLIAQNSYNTRSEFGTTEDRMSNLFSSMNKSNGRQRLIDVDRNALVIPPLYLSLNAPDSRSYSRGLSRGTSILFHNSGTTSFGSRSGSTPPSSARRSKTPPPNSVSASASSAAVSSGSGRRAKTPPATKRNSLQTQTQSQVQSQSRSRTPPSTSSSRNRSSSETSRPVSFDGRRQSVPASLGSQRMETLGGHRQEHSPQVALLPNGRNSRIPMLAFPSPTGTVTSTGTGESRQGPQTPSSNYSQLPASPPASSSAPGTPFTSSLASPADHSSHRLSIGRRSGIPQRANNPVASPSLLRTPPANASSQLRK
jgi:hypothetical protein